MAHRFPKGKARPPAVMERVARLLIPPAAREEVVGDLWERYRSPLRYASEALSVMPFLVASQIRRNTNVPALAIAAFVFFVFCFGGNTATDARPMFRDGCALPSRQWLPSSDWFCAMPTGEMKCSRHAARPSTS